MGLQGHLHQAGLRPQDTSPAAGAQGVTLIVIRWPRAPEAPETSGDSPVPHRFPENSWAPTIFSAQDKAGDGSLGGKQALHSQSGGPPHVTRSLDDTTSPRTVSSASS